MKSFCLIFVLVLVGSEFVQAQRQPIPGQPRLVLNPQGALGRTTAMAYSPDGARVAVSSLGKVVNIYDVGWNRPDLGPGIDKVTPVSTLRWEVARADRGVIRALAYSSQDIIAVGGYSARVQIGDIILFDAGTGEVVQSLPIERDAKTFEPGHKREVANLAFSPSGQYLLSSDKFGAVWLWHNRNNQWTGQQLLPESNQESERCPLAFLDDSQALITHQQNDQYSIELWQLGPNPRMLTPLLSDFASGVQTIAVHNNQRWASAGNDMGGNVQYVENNVLQNLPGQADEVVTAIEFLTDGRLAVIRKQSKGRQIIGSTLTLYSTSGQVIDRTNLSENTASVAIAASSDGRRLITHNDDQMSLLVYDLQDGQGRPIPQPLTSSPPREVVGRLQQFDSISASDDTTLLLGNGQRSYRFDLQTLDLDPGNQPVQPNPGVSVLSRGIEQIAGKSMERLQVIGGAVGEILLDAVEQKTYFSAALIRDPNSQRRAVAIGTQVAGGIYVYEVTPNRPARLLRYYRDHAGDVLSLTTSPNQKFLFSSSRDHTVKIWSLAGLFDDDPAFSKQAAWGMRLAPNSPRVVELEPAGIAQARDLKIDDVVVRLQTLRDGRYIDTRDPVQIRQLLTDSSSLTEPYIFDVSRNGQVIPGARQVVAGWEPLATLVVDQAGDWALFTPSPNSYYAASVMNGPDLFGWQINQGPNFTPRFISADDLQKDFEKPDVLRRVFQLGSVEAALASLQNVQAPPLAEAAQELPQIRILRPAATDTFQPDAPVRIEAEVSGPNVALLDVNASHGGRSLGDPVSDRMVQGKRIVTFTTAARDPLNQFVVTAQDGVDATTSSHTTAQVSCRCVNLDPKPKEYVVHFLGIGVSKYSGDWGKLDFSIRDIEELNKLLKQCVNDGPISEVRTKLLLEDSVTRQEVAASIGTLIERISESNRDDIAVIYVAGHGESVAGKFRFIPAGLTTNSQEDIEAKGIPWSVFADLQQLPCRVLWMLDTCKSGAAVLDFSQSRDTQSESQKSIVRSARFGGKIVISSAGANEDALEDSRFRGGHGAFSASVLDGLEGGADGSAEEKGEYQVNAQLKDGRLTLEELIAFVKNRTYTHYSGFQQEPRATPSNIAEVPPTLLLRFIRD